MRFFMVIVLLFAFGCTSSETRTQDASAEKTVEKQTVVEQKKGVEAGQHVDVVTTKTTQTDKLTEREARLASNTVNTVNMPAVPVGGLMDILGGIATGNWGTVVASLGTLLAGLTVGRKTTESKMVEMTEGVDAFVKANPSSAPALQTELSKAMSKSTKQTVRHIKP